MTEFADGPHAKRSWLKNGNRSGDLTTTARCGAKTRCGKPCRAPAMTNGRCRMHGGCSTGPKTPEGLERSTKANWKHGRYSAKALAGRKRWSWVGRFISVLKNYDKLNRLLMIIAAQVDANETSGLKAKCRTALKLWRQFLKMLETEPADGRSKNECMTEPADRIITRMLDAGIAGDSAQTIRAKLALWRLLTVEETRSFQEPLTVRHP